MPSYEPAQPTVAAIRSICRPQARHARDYRAKRQHRFTQDTLCGYIWVESASRENHLPYGYAADKDALRGRINRLEGQVSLGLRVDLVEENAGPSVKALARRTGKPESSELRVLSSQRPARDAS